MVLLLLHSLGLFLPAQGHIIADITIKLLTVTATGGPPIATVKKVKYRTQDSYHETYIVGFILIQFFW